MATKNKTITIEKIIKNCKADGQQYQRLTTNRILHTPQIHFSSPQGKLPTNVGILIQLNNLLKLKIDEL